MTIWTVIGIIALLAVVVFLKRGSGNRPASSSPIAARAAASSAERSAKRAPEVVDSFSGAIVFAEKDACAAVQRLLGKVFPENRLPRIPADGCDQTKCECRLHRIKGRRLKSRRVKNDRRGDIRFGDERRDHHDRRSAVENWERPLD